jgi:hypothetical protein
MYLIQMKGSDSAMRCTVSTLQQTAARAQCCRNVPPPSIVAGGDFMSELGAVRSNAGAGIGEARFQ